MKTSLALAFLLVISAQNGIGADQYWGSLNGSIATSTNWFDGPNGALSNPGAVPSTLDVAIFDYSLDLSNPYLVTDHQDRLIRALKVGGDDVTFDLGGHSLQLIRSTTFGNPADGTLVMGGSAQESGSLTLIDSTLESVGEIVIAAAANTNQTLTIGEEAFLDVDSVYFGSSGPRDLHLGVNGTGLLVLQDGGAMIARDLRVGIETGSVGTLTLNAVGGNGTRADLLGDTVFGERGTAFGVISNGATLTTTGRSSVGADVTSPHESLVTIQSGGRWFGNAFEIGGLASGRLSLSDGSTVNGSLFTIASRNPGDDVMGMIDLQSGSQLHASAGMLVDGSNGTARLEVRSDSDVEIDHSLTVGSSQGSDGLVLLTGSGSSIDVMADVSIGEFGEGVMTIENGADFTSERGYIGNRVNAVSGIPSIGRVTVSGMGSTWTNASFLYLGHYGMGTLNVTNGAVMTAKNQSVFLGRYATGTGTLTITGDGAEVDATGQLVAVGRLGSGHLRVEGTLGKVNVADPPQLLAKDLVVGYSADSEGMVTVLNGNGAGSNAARNLVLEDSLTVGRAGQGEMYVDTTYATASQVTIGELDGSFGDLQLRQTLLRALDTLTVGQAGTGTLLVDEGSTLNLKHPERLVIGKLPGSVGTITLIDSVMGPWNGSDYSVPHQPVIGDAGMAFLHLTGSSIYYSDGPIVGNQADSMGTVVIRGDSSAGKAAIWSIGAQFDGVYSPAILGKEGQAMIIVGESGILGAQSLHDRQIILGDEPGSQGTIRVEAGGLFESQGIVTIGDGGLGELIVEPGGRSGFVHCQVGYGSAGLLSVESASSGAGFGAFRSFEAGVGIGGNAEVDFGQAAKGTVGEGRLGIDGGTSVLRIDGEGTHFAVEKNTISTTPTLIQTSGSLHVGDSGNGSIGVTDGGRLTVGGSLTLGEFKTGTGAVTVLGEASRLEVAEGPCVVGGKGTGSLSVQLGGYAEFPNLTLSQKDATSSIVSVRGESSTLSVPSGLLWAGQAASSAISVLDGGEVFADVARVSNGSSVTINGGGSSFVTVGDFDLDENGINALAIFNSGRLEVGGTLRIGSDDTVSLTNAGSLHVTRTVGDLINEEGILRPGGDQPALSLITGDYTQHKNARMLMEIGGLQAGTDFDTLEITGVADLGGTLAISLANGYAPQAGQSFPLITATEILRHFDAYDLPPLTGLRWNVIEKDTSITLKTVAIPPIEQWRERHGLDLNGANDFEDWSENGIVNLLYYAFGMGDPRATTVPDADVDAGLLGLPVITPGPSSDRYFLDYVRRRSANPGVFYTETSTSDPSHYDHLRGLAGSLAIQGEQRIPIDDDYEFVRLELLFAHDRRFHQIEVSH